MITPVAPVEAAFRSLARLRHARVFHPHGVLFDAVWTGTATAVDEPIPAFRAGYRSDAVVRLSRGVGLPAPLPDVLGVAVRLPAGGGLDGVQDLLLASALATPVGIDAFWPDTDFTSVTYSTVVAHDVAGRPLLVRARTDRVGPGGFGLGDATRSAPGWGLVGPAGGPDVPVAQLHVGAPRRGPSPDFDQLHDGAGISPPPLLAQVRAAAYRGSRRGRGADAGREAVAA